MDFGVFSIFYFYQRVFQLASIEKAITDVQEEREEEAAKIKAAWDQAIEVEV